MDYINPTTGKGWSPREEEIIEHIMAADSCTRIEAVRRMRRRKLDDLRGKIASVASIGEPAKNSPVGALTVKLLAKNPGMDSEAARQEAHRLLDKAAAVGDTLFPGSTARKNRRHGQKLLRSSVALRRLPNPLFLALSGRTARRQTPEVE